MSVQGWRWWQWLLVSLVIGALVGFTVTNREMDDPSMPSTSLQNFVHKLQLRTDSGDPVLTKIRVSPLVADDMGKMVQVVTFWERLKNKETGKWDPVNQYRLYTTIPVFPAAPRKDYGILDFLADQKKTTPTLDTGYSWWKVPRNAWILAMGGSVLVIGVLWPIAIRTMVAMGLGHPETVDDSGYDLSKVRTRKGAAPPAAVPNDAAAAELAAINARLESNVADMLLEEERLDEARRNDESQRKAEEAVIRRLSDVPLETQESANKAEDKSFDGEFYPVARPTKTD